MSEATEASRNPSQETKEPWEVHQADKASSNAGECCVVLAVLGHIRMRECGGQMKVVSFIEPPQADVIEEILKHCRLWQARAARGPPEVDNLVLELDASYMDSSIDSQDQAEPPELTYIDIDPFLESF